MVRLRFNLGRGVNYKKWQVKTLEEGTVVSTLHYDPKEVVIILKNATLHNNKATAKKIFLGKNKTVCAWVTAEDAFIITKQDKGDIEFTTKYSLRYNPRVAPYWRDIYNNNMDDTYYKVLGTNDTNLYNISKYF